MSNIVITGCSSGIGFATSVFLAQNGHTVFATMRNPLQNTELQNLADKKNLPIIVEALDVTKEDSVKSAFTKILEYTGKIDVLINNAGIAELGAVEESPIENFIRDMDTNFFGAIRCTKAVLPHMREKKSGCIINISSVGAKFYSYFNSSYSATKAALEAFSECLAMEVLPFGIRVVVVEPGVVETPMQQKCKPKSNSPNYPKLKRSIAFFSAATDHHVSPEVVAEVVNDIVSGNSKKFRNPAGPDSIPALAMRASINDEDWIASAEMDEEHWIQSMEGMGLDVRKYLNRL